MLKQHRKQMEPNNTDPSIDAFLTEIDRQALSLDTMIQGAKGDRAWVLMANLTALQVSLRNAVRDYRREFEHDQSPACTS